MTSRSLNATSTLRLPGCLGGAGYGPGRCEGCCLGASGY